MSGDREDTFFAFLQRAIGTESLATRGEPLQAAIINALVGAFETCHPKVARDGRRPDFSDPMFSTPNTVYVIRNTITGRAYVGKALEGFTKRYARGEWWADDCGREHHHNQSLAEDALLYGLSAFQTHIHVCNDISHAELVESQLIGAHRRCTYNLLPEPTVTTPTRLTFEEEAARATALSEELRAKHGVGKVAP